MSGTSDCLLKRKKKNTVSDEQHVHLLWGEILQIIVATPRVPSIYHSLGSFGAIDPSVNKNKTACVCRVSSSHTWHRNHVPALTLCHIFVIHCRIRSVACFPIWNQLQHSTCFILFQRHPAAVVQLQGDGDPAGHGGSGLGCSSGRCTNLWHLPQDQIRRWLVHRDDAPTCGICHKTKFADGCGNLCSYCQTKFCARCGGRVSLRSNTVREVSLMMLCSDLCSAKTTVMLDDSSSHFSYQNNTHQKCIDHRLHFTA